LPRWQLLLRAGSAFAAARLQLSQDIADAIRGRSGYVAIRVEDVRTGVECRLNDPVLWVINSIGAIEGHGRDYKMAILTYNNPSEQYGINTVQAIAEAANHDLNSGLPAAGTPLAPITLPRSLQGRPDEVLPTGAH